jgi:hypothetical protein
MHQTQGWLLTCITLLVPLATLADESCITTPLVQGTVWQPDNATANPIGNWHRIGANHLLVQWTIVDEVAFIPGTPLTQAPTMPDWGRIAKEPWAQEVILGLAGHFDETLARNNIPRLIEISQQLAALPTPLHVVGWYFPVEIDPTWSDVTQLATRIHLLPRPLWISVYDSANWGPKTLADSLANWLPNDVGVFFQDGVGVHARTADVARQYADVLTARFGKNRVKIIAEAFRPKVGGGFRSATVDELLPQISAYKTHEIYLFDGPHYVTDPLIDALHQKANRSRPID